MLLPPLLSQKLTQSPRTPEQQQVLQHLANYDRLIVGPALLGVWIFGSSMASVAGWWIQPWFWTKLTVAFILSGLHGALAGQRKRCLANPDLLIKSGTNASALVALGLIAAVGLVLYKPMTH